MAVDAINNILGDIGFSFGKVIDKVKSTATDAAAKYQELSPQAQAIKAGAKQFGNSMRTEKSITPSGRTISRRVPASSGAIPTTSSNYKGRMKISDLFSRLSKKKVFGVRVLYLGAAGLISIPILMKLKKKK